MWLHALEETYTGTAGDVVLLRGTLRDITRQKQAEAERDNATQRLNTALYGSNLILVDVDPAGVVFLSERWNELLGGPPQGDVHDVRCADRADARGRARGDPARIRRRDHRAQGRIQHRASRARQRRQLAVDPLARPRRRARRAWPRAPAGGHQRGHHVAQARRGAAGTERIALPQPARAFDRLVLGAGRVAALHRGVGHRSESRPAGRGAVPRPPGDSTTGSSKSARRTSRATRR